MSTQAAPPATSPADADNVHETASTYRSRAHAGAHKLTISPYSLAQGIGVGNCVTSGEFTVAGHRWTIQYYPDGVGDNHGYASVLLFLAGAGGGRTDDVHVLAEFGLLHRATCAVKHSRTISLTFRPGTPEHQQQQGQGCPEFVRRGDLAASGCLADDCLVVTCTVRVVETELVDDGEVVSVRVPPPDLHRDLGRVLLRDGVGADVTFLVRGRAFRAHRCVLAARSPVLRAGLYDAPMKESTADVVEIDEMEPEAFAAMLHFIYNDALPETAAADGGACMAQHLLVAADRYALERLSLACQDRLSRRTDAATAADTYALAHQHGFPRLKAAVVEFLARRHGRLEAVTASAGFRRIAEVDPAIADDLVSKVTAVRRRRKVTQEVPASCLRLSKMIGGCCLRCLAMIWAWCVRFFARVWAYTRANLPFILRVVVAVLITVVQLLAEHPEFFRHVKKLKKLLNS
ncbi:hypothetical protein ACP70R_018104 [Stipagrostis hirtigluma subsp. patula]